MPVQGGRASRMATRPVADVRVRNAYRVARMRAAPALPRSAVSARPAAQARRNVAVPTRHAAPARPNPRMLRLRVAARRNPPSGPRRPRVRHQPRLHARRSRLPQSARSLPPRRPSALPVRPLRSANGTGIVRPASVRGSNLPQPKRRQARRLRQLSRPHLQPRLSSGLPQAPRGRPMQSAPPVPVTPSDRTGSAPVTSVPARIRPPRPQPRRRPHQPRQRLHRRHPRLQHLRRRRRQPGPSRLRQLPQLLPPQRAPCLRLRLHRSRPRLSRQLLPRASRWMRPASVSRTCVAIAASVAKAAG